MISPQDAISLTPPPQWRVVPFWSLFQRTKSTGHADEELLSVYRDHGVIPTSSRDDNHNKPSEDLSGYQLITEGALVTNKMKAWQGSIAISRYRGIVSPAYYVYQPLSEEHDQFLHYLLRSEPYIALYRRISKGVRVSQWDLEHEAFRTIPVPLPDLTTQKQIADFLDTETARVDALIEKKQRLVAVLEERLDQLVRALVTGKASTKGFNHELVESGVDYLGSVPRSWCINKVGLRYRIQLGKMLDDAKQTGRHKRPYLRVADVQWGQINTENLPEMDFQPSDQKKFALRKGDLIVNEGGSYVGRSAIWNGDLAECYYQKALHRVRARKPTSDSVEFLYYLMRFATKLGVFVAGGNQTTIDHLTAEAFGRYRFAFPEFGEQQEIATALRYAESKQAALQVSIDASIASLREYRAALITAAVTGQIDVAENAQPVAVKLPPRADAEVFPLHLAQQSLNRPDRRTVRLLVAADVVHRLRAQPSFGRIKLQKLMYLAEAHANINDIGGYYERYRAGPYDGAMVQEIEAGMRQEQFYDAKEDTTADRGRVTFQRMPRAGDHRNALYAALGDKVASLRSMVDLFKDMNTEATEAVATLYAVWNDARIDGQQPDDTAVIRGFLQDWHADKGKFKEADLQNWLGWMRRNGIVPRGAGPRTISTSTPSLFESE